MTLLIASVGLGALAYGRALRGADGRWSVSLLALLFAAVFALIHDLDRPRTGMVTVSQEALRALRASLSIEAP